MIDFIWCLTILNGWILNSFISRVKPGILALVVYCWSSRYLYNFTYHILLFNLRLLHRLTQVNLRLRILLHFLLETFIHKLQKYLLLQNIVLLFFYL